MASEHTATAQQNKVNRMSGFGSRIRESYWPFTGFQECERPKQCPTVISSRKGARELFWPWLAELYEPQQAKLWLFSRHKLLNGERPVDLIPAGEAERNINVLRASLTVTANGLGKTYGQAITFAGTEFMTSGLVVNDDSAPLIADLQNQRNRGVRCGGMVRQHKHKGSPPSRGKPSAPPPMSAPMTCFPDFLDFLQSPGATGGSFLPMSHLRRRQAQERPLTLRIRQIVGEDDLPVGGDVEGHVVCIGLQTFGSQATHDSPGARIDSLLQ